MAFDERVFINKKRSDWERLAIIVERIKSASLGSLRRDELTTVGTLYRRAAADLSYARAQGANPNLILYLNELVGNAHGTIYAEAPGGWSGIWKFFGSDLPTLLRKRMPFILASVALTVLGALYAYLVIKHDPAMTSMFIPEEFKSSFDAWKQGFSDHGDVPVGEGTVFSSGLMTHNTLVGIVCFVLGVFIVIPILLVFQNGVTMGTLIAVVQPTGHLASMWAGILPHGVCELSALFICGASGMLIGWSILVPGRLSRKDAVAKNGIEACQMMVGTVPLFIIAGILEGNVSHSSLSHAGKFSLAALQFILLMWYIYGPVIRVKKPKAQSSINPHTSQIIERALSSR